MVSQKKPSQHVLALITFIALVPLVYVIPPWVATWLPGQKLLQVVIAVGMIVPLISYIVIPCSLSVMTRFKR